MVKLVYVLGMINEALAFAIAFMGGPAPDFPLDIVHVKPVVIERLCPDEAAYECDAVFYVSDDGRGTIVTSRLDDFGLFVHEFCHAVQWARGDRSPLNEEECFHVQRAGMTYIAKTAKMR